MSTKKNKYMNGISPRGVAVYPKLNAPRKWDEKKQQSVEDWKDGKFEVEIALDTETAEAFKAKLIAFAKEQGVAKPEKLKNLPWKEEVNKETKEETGRLLFKFKNYATNQDSSRKRIPHVDAKAKKLDADFRLTSGSEVKIDYSASVFTTLGGGIRLLVNAVQVLKYVEQEFRNNFGAEDGYSADDEADGEESSFDREDEGSDSNEDATAF